MSNGKFSLCLLIMMIFCLAATICAETASHQEMQRICQNWLTYIVHKHGNWAGEANPTIKGISEIRSGDILLGIHFSISPVGYIVVPALKELPPVRLYSDKADLEFGSPESMGEIIRGILKEQTEAFIKTYGSMESRQTGKDCLMFDNYSNGKWAAFSLPEDEFRAVLPTLQEKSQEAVGPLLESQWDQTAPYNDSCPVGLRGMRCATGCTATALAQILWYYAWPPAGFGRNFYYWSGDYSYEGESTPPRALYGNYSDRFSWTTTPGISEICHEAGLMNSMDYGAFGSGAWPSAFINDGDKIMAYRSDMQELKRYDYLPFAWFPMLRHELDEGRPILYVVRFETGPLHSVVVDGYDNANDFQLIHINFGWAEYCDGWFTVDNINACGVYMQISDDRMYSNIEPDKTVTFYCDTIFGPTPFEVQFAGLSDSSVTSWNWDFGDGGSSNEQNPVHTYEESGIYDVALTINCGDTSFTRLGEDHIWAINDTVYIDGYRNLPGNIIEVTVGVKNTLPVDKLMIPVEYGEGLELTFDSVSLAGCRTESLEWLRISHQDIYNKRLTVSMRIMPEGFFIYPFVDPGTGPVMKLYFTSGFATPDLYSAVISTDGYPGYPSYFFGNLYGYLYTYNATGGRASVYAELICGDPNNDENVNLLDILYLIARVYNYGPAPIPVSAGDINGDGETNLLDILELIDYIYGDLTELGCAEG